MEVTCVKCKDIIARFTADTRRKTQNQQKKVVCLECVKNNG